jgi:hypothetical protein
MWIREATSEEIGSNVIKEEEEQEGEKEET